MSYEERFEILKATGRMCDADAKKWAKSDDATIYEVEDLKAHYDSYLEELFFCGETDEEEKAELKAQFDALLDGKLVNDYWNFAKLNGVEYVIAFCL